MSEIIIILFFLLALLSSIKLNEKDIENEKLNKIMIEKDKKYLAQKQVINNLLKKNEKLNMYFDELVNIQEYKNKIILLEKEVEKLNSIIKNLNELKKNIKNLDEINFSIKQELKEKNDLLEDIKEKENIHKIKDMIQQCVELDTEVKTINEIINEKNELIERKDVLEKQITYYKRVQGLDYPPCWISDKGKARYLFHITLNESNLYIKEALWNENDREKSKKIPNIEKIINKDLSLNQFLKLVKPLYKQTVIEECRHFVIFKDNTETKKSYKTKTLKIENFFYKYIER